MAKCEFCGKGVNFGIQVSHSHRRSNRTWKPNVKRVKAIVDGSPKHVLSVPPLPPQRQGRARCIKDSLETLRNPRLLGAGVFVFYNPPCRRRSPPCIPALWAGIFAFFELSMSAAQEEKPILVIGA